MRREDLLEWYESMSSSYDELYGDEQGMKYVKVLNELGESVFNGFPKVLDSGCGTGKLLNELARRDWGVYYVGIDLSLNQLLHAQENFKELSSGYFMYDLIAGDLAKPPFREGVFDIVLSFTVVRDIAEDLEIINNLRRLMAHDGVLAYTVLLSEEKTMLSEEFCAGVRGELTRLENYCVEVRHGES